MARSKRKTWLGWTALAAALGILLAWSLWPRAIGVDVASATRGPMTVTLDEEGETRVRERFVVSAPVAGRLRRIELEPGAPVERGETVLAILDPLEPAMLDARERAATEAEVRAAGAALRRLEAERDRARAELGFAETEAGRYRRLAAEAVASAEQLDLAVLEAERCSDLLRAAEFAVVDGRHRLAMARARLEVASGGDPELGGGVAIRAPVDGVVLRRLRESASAVAAGEPLVEVGDPEDLEIVADFLSSDAVQIAPGMPVVIERWGGSGALEGRVRRVEPAGFMKVSALGVEEQRVNVVIDLLAPPPSRGRLGDAFRVEVRAVVWQADDVLTVPIGSLFRHGEGWAVFAAVAGRARLTAVEIGRRNDREAEVLGGLTAGDAVILHPGDAVAEGVRVVAR